MGRSTIQLQLLSSGKSSALRPLFAALTTFSKRRSNARQAGHSGSSTSRIAGRAPPSWGAPSEISAAESPCFGSSPQLPTKRVKSGALSAYASVDVQTNKQPSRAANASAANESAGGSSAGAGRSLSSVRATPIARLVASSLARLNASARRYMPCAPIAVSALAT
jgi:hypothetical protein